MGAVITRTEIAEREVVRRMRDMGVIAGYMGSAMEMAPPLIITREELDHTVKVCAQAIWETARSKGLA
jgi:adenosylmethionine-8-amino-7-oxononanoate aminotransferase